MNRATLYAFSIAGMLLSPLSALAQETSTATPSTPTATASTAPAEDPNEIICRAGEPTVGSRIPGSRVCHTRKEWNDLQYQSGHQVYQMQEGSRYSSGNPGH